MSKRRILINILTTYGRSVISFLLSLFTARWILEALGERDFGLYGVVGGIMFFVSLINITQSTTVARYYAYSIGQGGRDLQNWFNSALSIHILLPVLLVSLGYFVGMYALRNWLEIPVERLDACIFVFRLSLITLAVSIVAVPYSALFVAYQYISQLVLFSFVHVFGAVAVSYALFFVSIDRLKCYAVMGLVLNMTVYALQIFVARRKFRECRISFAKMFDFGKMRNMLAFSGMKLLGDLAWGVRNNGSAFVANVGIGNSSNAALNIANQLSAQACSLCNTISTAFVPAITTEEGAGQRAKMIDLSTRCCKFGTLMLLIIAVPLIVVVDDWLVIWLKTPPAGSNVLCVCMVVASLVVYVTNGYQIAIQAHGDIFKWQIMDALSHIVAIPVACLFLYFKYGIISIGYGFIVSSIAVSGFRLYFARKLIGISIRKWFSSVLLPILLLWCFAHSAAVLFGGFASRGFLRLFMVGISSAMVTVCLAWFFAFDKSERLFVKNLVKRFRAKFTST